MVMVSLGNLIRPPASGVDGRLGGLGWDQAVTSTPDQVRTTGFQECFPHHEVILGLEELERRPLHLPVP
jgi:hypothetical protein